MTITILRHTGDIESCNKYISILEKYKMDEEHSRDECLEIVNTVERLLSAIGFRYQMGISTGIKYYERHITWHPEESSYQSVCFAYSRFHNRGIWNKVPYKISYVEWGDSSYPSAGELNLIDYAKKCIKLTADILVAKTVKKQPKVKLNIIL